jgi:hypothetical protein
VRAHPLRLRGEAVTDPRLLATACAPQEHPEQERAAQVARERSEEVSERIVIALPRACTALGIFDVLLLAYRL